MLIEMQIWCQPVHVGWLCGGLSKGTVVPTSNSVPERVPPPALALTRDNSVSPYISLALSKLQFLHWSFGLVFVHE